MAVDESFKRPGTIPFKWEVQPGIPKPEPSGAGGHGITAAAPPRLAPPPAARVGSQLATASCRRTGFDASVMPLSPPPPKSSHRRSMSARFATSLVMLPFARRSRRSRTEDDAEFCLLFGERIA